MRETQELTIKSNTFVVKTYASAREVKVIQQVYFKGAKFEIVGDVPKMDDFNPSVQFDVNEQMVTQMVVSMNGSENDIINRCLDLPSDEYNELIAALDALVSKKKN